MATVPTQRAAWTDRCFEILADGEWHDQRTLAETAAPLVPPGIAYRTAEKDRNRPQHRPNGPGPRLHGDDDTSVRRGAIDKVQETLRKQIARGHLERRYVAGRAQVRLPSGTAGS